MPLAYLYDAHGGPEVEALRELPRPIPGPGQLLVAVRAAGVNPVDWKRRTGYLPAGAPAPTLPAVLGGEVAGVVEEVGPGVDGFAIGDEVFGNPSTGGYAEYTLLPVEQAAHKPSELSFEDASTLPIAAATAFDGIVQLALPAGATLLILGVGGGVGVAAAQIARDQGLTVIGIASAGKREFVESLGVVHIDAGPDAASRVRAAAPGGIDGIFDLVGGQALEDVVELLPDRSKLITAADRQGVARLGGAPVHRVRNRAVLDAVAQLAVKGVLNPYVLARWPLAEAGEALRSVEHGHTRGKVVLVL